MLADESLVLTGRALVGSIGVVDRTTRYLHHVLPSSTDNVGQRTLR